MKKKIDWRKFMRKETIGLFVLAALFCTGLVVANSRNGEIPLHDGDVLVDSRNVVAEEAVPGQEEEPGEETQSTQGSFSEMRATLDMDRNKMIAALDETLANSENETEKDNANQSKEKLMNTMKQEIEIESIIASKSLPESFVLITDSSVTVTVDQQELEQNTVAKICEIVMRETGRTADKIIIQSNY